MNIELIKATATGELLDVLNNNGVAGYFTVTPGEPLTEGPTKDDPRATVEYEVAFKFGNVEQKHSLLIGWNEDDGVGLEQGEDGDLEPITYSGLMSSFYYDLVLRDLDDKYCS